MINTPVKVLRSPEETIDMLIQLRNEIYEKVKGLPITGPNDILMRINACLYLPRK